METVRVSKLTELMCQEMLDTAKEEVRFYGAKEDKLTDFGRYSFESAKKRVDKFSGYLYLMNAEKKDCIYVVDGNPIPYEVGKMLFELKTKKNDKD